MRAALHSAPPVTQAQASRRKPAVTPVDDPLEHEADRIADAVVADRFPGKASGITSYSGQGSTDIPPSVARTLASPAEPLGQAQRDYFEPRFGRDLSGIFIHRDAAAGQSAAALAAEAYTFKNHIVFGAGQYTHGSTAGRHLLAHELGHTIQQLNSTMPVIQRRPNGRPDEEADRIGVVSITTYEGSRRGQAGLSNGATVEVELVNNALPIGEHRLIPVGRVKSPKFQGDDKFMWSIPVDPLTGEVFDGLEPVVKVQVQQSPGGQFRELSPVAQELITSPGGRKASAEDIANAALAGQVLENALTPDELLLLEVRRREKKLNGESGAPTGDPLEFALGIAEAREAAKLAAGDNWTLLVQISKMLGKEPIYIIRRGRLGNVLDPGSYAEKKAFFLGLVQFYMPGVKFSSAAEIEATGSELFEGFQTILGRFENSLVTDLRNLAETALDSAEASILRMDRQYAGIWQTKVWSPHYFWDEVKKIKGNEKVVAAAGERDKVKTDLDQEQREDALSRAVNPIGSLLEPVFSSSSYSQRTDERDKERERQDQLFNQTVAEQSNLKITQAGSAQNILEATTPQDAVSRLRNFLWDGRKRIIGAREKIKDRTVLYAADKIIEAEKAELKEPLGADASDIGMVIDAFAKYRKSQTSLWEDILKVIEFVSMFVPGPIGWGLRFGTAVLGFDRKMKDIGARRDLHGANLSANAVGSGEVGSAVFEAVSQVADVPAIGKVAKGERLTLGLERTATRGADDAASVASRTASSAEHGTPQGLAGDAAGGAKVPDPPPGAQQIENAPQARPDLGVPTYGNLPGRVPTGGQRVQIIEKDGKYFERDYDTGALTPASGEYAFARMPDGTLWGSRYGHAEASMGGRVAYPGQVTFENGVRKEWSGASGTYKPVGGEFAGQAGFNTPPVPIPPHPGKKSQLPMFQEPHGSVIIPPKVDKSLRTLGVSEHDMVHFANGEKVFGGLTRGGIEFTPYFIKEGDTLVAGVLSAYSKGDKAGMIKAYLTFRRSSMEMAKGMGAKTLRLEADVVVNTEGLVDSLIKQGYKLVDESSNKYALEIPLR